MSEKSYLKLNQSSILNVPFQMYDEFLFIVNGKEFKTTRLISDLLSPKICKIHINDPTINQFIINTTQEGDFNHILKLVNFEKNEVNQNEIEFITEIVEYLGNEKINYIDERTTQEFNEDNIFTILNKHLKFPLFYSKKIDEDIDFISSHFFSLLEDHESEMKSLEINILERILNNDKLKLLNEDQLLQFVDQLYSENSKYSNLFEYILFKNVQSTTINEFIDIYNIEHINTFTWKSLTERLKQEFINIEYISDRYENIFKFDSNNPFNGIFTQFQKDGSIANKIKITANSIRSGSPEDVILYNDKSKFFQSNGNKNSWICFDFLENKIEPNYYSIKTKSNSSENEEHPKSWVIEGSDNNSDWEIIDEQKNCSYFHGGDLVHSFEISNKKKDKKFQYIRMRQTDTNWRGDDDLMIGWFEIFGKLSKREIDQK